MPRLFKWLLTVILFSGSLVLAQASEATMSCDSDMGYEILGPPDVFPWGSEVPFPWRGIQGTWVAQSADCSERLFFTFKSVNSSNSERLLLVSVFSYNGFSCQKLGQGPGYEHNKVVISVVNGPNLKPTEVKVHVFRGSDLRKSEKDLTSAGNTRNVTVLTMAPVRSGNVETDKVFWLRKVSTKADNNCMLGAR